MIGKIINKITNEENIHVLITIFIYANVLGIGFANYWLYLTCIVLIIYGKKGCNKNGKNINCN